MGIVHVQPSGHQCSSSVAGDEGFQETFKECSSLSNFFPGIHFDGLEFETGFALVYTNTRGRLTERKNKKKHAQTHTDVRQLAMARHTPLRMCRSQSSDSIHQARQREREHERGKEERRSKQRLRGER